MLLIYPIGSKIYSYSSTSEIDSSSHYPRFARSTVPALYYVMLRSHHGILSDRVASAEEEDAGFGGLGALFG